MSFSISWDFKGTWIERPCLSMFLNKSISIWSFRIPFFFLLFAVYRSEASSLCYFLEKIEPARVPSSVYPCVCSLRVAVCLLSHWSDCYISAEKDVLKSQTCCLHITLHQRHLTSRMGMHGMCRIVVFGKIDILSRWSDCCISAEKQGCADCPVLVCSC